VFSSTFYRRFSGFSGLVGGKFIDHKKRFGSRQVEFSRILGPSGRDTERKFDDELLWRKEQKYIGRRRMGRANAGA